MSSGRINFPLSRKVFMFVNVRGKTFRNSNVIVPFFFLFYWCVGTMSVKSKFVCYVGTTSVKSKFVCATWLPHQASMNNKEMMELYVRWNASWGLKLRKKLLRSSSIDSQQIRILKLIYNLSMEGYSCKDTFYIHSKSLLTNVGFNFSSSPIWASLNPILCQIWIYFGPYDFL